MMEAPNSKTVKALQDAFTAGANWASAEERATANKTPLGLSEIEAFETMLENGSPAINVVMGRA